MRCGLHVYFSGLSIVYVPRDTVKNTGQLCESFMFFSSGADHRKGKINTEI